MSDDFDQDELEQLLPDFEWNARSLEPDRAQVRFYVPGDPRYAWYASAFAAEGERIERIDEPTFEGLVKWPEDDGRVDVAFRKFTLRELIEFRGPNGGRVRRDRSFTPAPLWDFDNTLEEPVERME